MRFLNDGVDKVTLLATQPADIDAMTVTEANAGDDHSGSIVNPLDVNFADSARFTFKTINVTGNAERNGRTNAAGMLRIVREYDAATLLVDATEDATFAAFGTKGTAVKLAIRRGPKPSADEWETGDEYDYIELETDTARKVAEDDQYIVYDVPLVFSGTSAAQKVVVAAA